MNQSQTVEPGLAVSHASGSKQQLMFGAGLLGGVGAGVGMALAGYAFYLEPFRIELDHLVVRVPSARARLPAAGLKILHVSDFHFQGKDERERYKIERLRQLTAGIEYDLLINTGDFLQYDEGLQNVLALYKALPQPRLGSYAVLGNHDYATYNMRKAIPYTWRNFLARESRYGKARPLSTALSRREHVGRYLRFLLYLFFRRVEGERTGRNDVARLHYELERQGIRWLHNCAVHLNGDSGISGLDLYIAGIDDIMEGRPNLAAALRPVPQDAPLILVSHNPDVLESPAALRADLLLAGHTHGGQIVLPLVGPAHTQSDHLSRREAAGYFRRGKTHIYINRGLGEGIPLRFGAPPHITLIEMRDE